jgi:hypothetical protein
MQPSTFEVVAIAVHGWYRTRRGQEFLDEFGVAHRMTLCLKLCKTLALDLVAMASRCSPKTRLMCLERSLRRVSLSARCGSRAVAPSALTCAARSRGVFDAPVERLFGAFAISANHRIEPGDTVRNPIRKGLLALLFKSLGLDGAKEGIDQIVQITRLGPGKA